ncbi:hypothetical protein MESS2_770022 [Mesorhizobium metallidurans STM 2683]|uniref:Uncharacterized protein n=1 Tax=Mesorhizobium metallidurans STM 2683 TaxID=1297569 RepID=M5EWL8_9HYPH|nr:hypothetical protein MESS2_770022 [Mesorhizobium metallidurans STM 2683]
MDLVVSGTWTRGYRAKLPIAVRRHRRCRSADREVFIMEEYWFRPITMLWRRCSPALDNGSSFHAKGGGEGGGSNALRSRTPIALLP